MATSIKQLIEEAVKSSMKDRNKERTTTLRMAVSEFKKEEIDNEEKIRAKKMGIKDFNRKYNISDMVKGDVIFCATGVTSGDLASGVKDLGNEFEVNTFALHKSQNIIRSITNIYNK